MRWLIGVVLPLLVPVADVAAQQVSATVSSGVPSRGASSPAPQPEAFPQATRDEGVDAAGKGTWEMGLGFALLGFRSAPFDSTLGGLNTMVGYYLRDHLSVEGSITSAFELHSSKDSDAKSVFYGGGIKLNWGNRKWQPFMHAFIGGVHMFPQTAFGNNGFAAQVGGGVEKRLKPRVWLQFEGDYLRSQLYSSGQNNFQAVVGVNYRF